MIRFLIAGLGLPVLPAFLALLSWTSPSPALRPVWTPTRDAVWEIRAGQNAEMEALKSRIEALQGRVTAANERLTATVDALSSGR